MADALFTTYRRGSSVPKAPFLGQPCPVRHGKPSSFPLPIKVGVGGDAMRDAQADVPSARSFGRNLRSKTRWFTGFCNSHQVSHFATFFIDARAEISVAESRLLLVHGITTVHGITAHRKLHTLKLCSLTLSRRVLLFCKGWSLKRDPPAGRGASGCTRLQTTHLDRVVNMFAGHSAGQVSTMILPQVHLRKPCYDFSFL